VIGEIFGDRAGGTFGKLLVVCPTTSVVLGADGPFGVRLLGSLDGAALRRALDQILVGHEAVRTTFGSPQNRDLFLEVMGRVRKRYRFEGVGAPG
jgi:hypothetical protein